MLNRPQAFILSCKQSWPFVLLSGLGFLLSVSQRSEKVFHKLLKLCAGQADTYEHEPRRPHERDR